MNLKKYFALMKVGFKEAMAYRFHSLVTIVMTPISLVVYYFLWKSIFAYTGESVIKGFSFEAMVGYYVLSMIVGFFTWSQVDKWFEMDVRHGTLVSTMLQPMTYLSYQFFTEFGTHLFTLLVEAVPVLLIGYFFFYLPAASAINFILFMISIILAAILYFQFAFIIGLTAFWMKRIDGLRRMRQPLVAFLSGGILPLSFFPAWFTGIQDYLPFTYTRYTPIMIYLGNMSFSRTMMSLLVPVLWIVVMHGAILFMWNAGYKRFTGVGT